VAGHRRARSTGHFAALAAEFDRLARGRSSAPSGRSLPTDRRRAMAARAPIGTTPALRSSTGARHAGGATSSGAMNVLPPTSHRARSHASRLTDVARDQRHRRSALIVAPMVAGLALVVTVAATAAPSPIQSTAPTAAGLINPFASWVIPQSPEAQPLEAASATVVAPPSPKPKAPAKPKAVDAASNVPTVIIPSSYAQSGIPSVALKAYKKAAKTLKREDPKCGVPWELLAAIGRVESGHGTSGASVMTKSGLSIPGVFGPTLDGGGPFALIRDTDGGKYDGDKKYDRAIGPMQFLPATWAVVARDGNGDGKRQVQNIWDAALGAAEYLCRGNTRLGTPKGLAANIYRYNRSDAYVALVLGIMRLYGASVKIVPTQEPAKKPAPRKSTPSKPAPSKPAPSKPAPSKPIPTPSLPPTVSPSPSPPSPTPSA